MWLEGAERQRREGTRAKERGWMGEEICLCLLPVRVSGLYIQVRAETG